MDAEQEKQKGRGLAAKDSTPEERREAAAAMGRARTERKRAAVAKVAPINGLKGGRPKKELSEVPCTCGAGDSLKHKYNCPRYQLARRRAKAGGA